MTSRFVPMPGRSPLVAWWRSKSPGERQLAAALAALIVLVVSWLAVWEPLQRDVRRLRMDNRATQAALAQARADVDETTRLARSPSPAATDLRRDIEASLAKTGLRSAATDVQWQQGRARITFAAVDFGMLSRWLEALQRDAGIVVIDATLSARVEPGSVRAELTLGH
ncbi:MAG TPA: type II secretion system protein GspM [Casimicrobiaceae bacterium]|nr:type II secretion system protein GspM [Casimicrobiaceae bacterium]